jgi:dTDP-4-dehydrorhamnose reductase
MNILVTGAGGQLGQDMVQACRENEIPVLAADSKALDITNYPAVRDFLLKRRCDVVINCAAYNAVDLAEQDWKRAFLVNGLGVRNLACVINEYGGTLVHYSTDYVFDGDKEQPYTIADAPHPINRYGESKLLGEQFVRDLSERYYLIRVSWVFGKGNMNFPKKVIAWSKTNSELKIVDDQVSSPTYTIDLAEATLNLVGSGRYGLYHCTNAGSCSRFAWASYILESTGWDGTVIPVSSDEFETPARRPRFSVLDNFGTRETLGYSMPEWKDATLRFIAGEDNP